MKFQGKLINNYEKYYDFWHSNSKKNELDFYASYIIPNKKSLEVGCGTGRLLIPLLQRNYDIEGLDYSSSMLEQCKKKMLTLKLKTEVYLSAIEEFKKSNKYNFIFSAGETFQHIVDYKKAMAALKNIYDSLAEKGTCIISCSLPWLYAPENSSEWRLISQGEKDKKQVLLYEKSIHDPLAQLYYHSYQIKQGERLLGSYQTTVRWYSAQEFIILLRDAGFKEIIVQSGYQNQGPFDHILFIAKKQCK